MFQFVLRLHLSLFHFYHLPVTSVYLSVCQSTLCTNQILDLLIPEEEADLSDLVLEVTAGVGGQEAMLFTAEVCTKPFYHHYYLLFL